MTEDLLPHENLKPTPPALYNKPPLSICKALIVAFSTNERRRHPSWANKEKGKQQESDNTPPIHVRLITIGVSHYCEKARWALDRTESDPKSPYYYTEDAHPPLFQGIATLGASNGEVSMAPMVVFKQSNEETFTGSGGIINNKSAKQQKDTIMYDSGKIMKHFCPDLYPLAIESQITKLEEYIGRHLGATARCFKYYHMLNPQYYKVLAENMTQNSSSIEKFLWSKLLDKGLAEGMKKAMKINKESAQSSLEAIRTVFREMSEMLKESDNSTNTQKKQYLMDTKYHKYGFTAADLTFAALGAPLVGPPELEPFLKVDDDSVLPKPLVDLKHELRETLAGQHILEMYKKHRLNGRDEQVDKVIPKTVGRDKLPLGILALTFGAALSIVTALRNKGHLLKSKL